MAEHASGQVVQIGRAPQSLQSVPGPHLVRGVWVDGSGGGGGGRRGGEGGGASGGGEGRGREGGGAFRALAHVKLVTAWLVDVAGE